MNHGTMPKRTICQIRRVNWSWGDAASRYSIVPSHHIAFPPILAKARIPPRVATIESLLRTIGDIDPKSDASTDVPPGSRTRSEQLVIVTTMITRTVMPSAPHPTAKRREEQVEQAGTTSSHQVRRRIWNLRKCKGLPLPDDLFWSPKPCNLAQDDPG